jgi:hypothetical protein
VPERLTPVRSAFDDAKINLSIESIDLGSDSSDDLLLAHIFVVIISLI